MNILRNTRVYLAGNMEYSSDIDNWRSVITESLAKIGIKSMSPSVVSFVNQPAENPEFRNRMLAYREAGDFAPVEEHMKAVIEKDLRMIDLADFCIFNLEVSKPTFGTIHELVEACRQQKPIFVVIPDKRRTPLWILGLVKSKHIYCSLSEVVDRINQINAGNIELNSKKWKLLIPTLR